MGSHMGLWGHMWGYGVAWGAMGSDSPIGDGARQVQHRHVRNRDPERHPAQLPAGLWGHMGGYGVTCGVMGSGKGCGVWGHLRGDMGGDMERI